MDGTRAYRVGRKSAALVDPGPDTDEHLRALVAWVGDAGDLRIALTHGHGDHAGAARRLAASLGAELAGPPGIDGVDRLLSDGAEIETDQGTLVAVHTPGHAREHMCYLWREERALFAGDLVLGSGDTTWVGEYPGCVADYLASLERVRALAPTVIYPAHGPPLEDVPAALDRFEAHRRTRIRQVEAALAADPGATARDLLPLVYGTILPASMEAVALRSVEALVEYVRSGPAG